MKLQIRKATSKDVQILAEILTEAAHYKFEAHGDIAWQDRSTGSYDYLEREVSRYIANGDTYLASLGDDIVGTIALQTEDSFIWGEQPADAFYIHRLAIKGSYRGQNLGSQIIDWTALEAAKSGRQYLRLDFHPSNKGLQKYYENLGFAKKGSRRINAPHASYTTLLYERHIYKKRLSQVRALFIC